MIIDGSYNGLPLRVIPSNIYGGKYFLTYHGKRNATGTRRAFFMPILLKTVVSLA
jgi:hypothetical protein